MKSQEGKTGALVCHSRESGNPESPKRGNAGFRFKAGMTTKQKVFVAMSGGVDSSVAAALLIKEGYEVIGAHMRCFNLDGCAERDAEDARRVAEQLGIPFYVFDFEDEYKARVVDYMVKGYKAGITPNPDVMCNKEIKFGLFFEKARKLGADFVATGHYVRLRNTKNIREYEKQRNKNSYIRNNFVFRSLYTAKDGNKDQSYFLWTLTQKQLQRCLFPIGEYTKPQVRVLAKKFRLLTASKKDSQGICFLGEVCIRDFLKKYIKPKKGDVLTVDGRVVGTHDGAHLYTIGQRNLGIKNMGLGLKGEHGAVPHYVVAKDLKKNTITIAPENHPSLYQKEITLTNVNFIVHNYSLFTIHSSLPVLARVRYRQPLAKARLILFSNSQEFENSGKRSKKNATPYNLQPTTYKLVFDKPQKFIAVGQSAVFYLSAEASAKAGDHKGKEMLGGGIIAA